MAAFLIADIQVNDLDGYNEYIKLVPPLVEKHGGTYRARGGETQVLEGNWSPRRTVLIEFPDVKSAEAFYHDPEYKPVRAIRQDTTDTNLVIFEGL